jgi:phage I-like protein
MPFHLFFDLSAAFAVEPPSGEAPVIVDGTGEPPPEWVHILPKPDKDGLIYSRDYRIVDVDDLEKLAARSNAAIREQKGGQPIDADHELYDWGGGPAKAWAEEFEARPDGLWARVDWLKAGADLVTSKQYRYTSSVIDGPAKWQLDEDGWPETLTITAEAIVGFGVTNIPALKTHSMFTAQHDLKQLETLRVMARKIGLDDNATPEQIKTAFHRFTAVAPPADPLAESEQPAGDDQPASESGAQASDKPEPEIESEATPDAESVEALRRKLAESDAALAAANDRITKLEQEQARDFIAQLCRDGKMTPAQKKAALALAEKPGGLDGLRALYSNAPRVVDGNRPQSDATELAAETPPANVDPLAWRLHRAGKPFHEIVAALSQRNQENKSR